MNHLAASVAVPGFVPNVLGVFLHRLRSAGTSPLTLRNCSPDLLTNFNFYVHTHGY